MFFSGILDGEPLKVLHFLWFEGFPKIHTQSLDAKKLELRSVKVTQLLVDLDR